MSGKLNAWDKKKKGKAAGRTMYPSAHTRVRAVLGLAGGSRRCAPRLLSFGRGANDLVAAGTHAAFLTCESTSCADPRVVACYMLERAALLHLRRIQRASVLSLAVARSPQQCADYVQDAGLG